MSDQDNKRPLHFIHHHLLTFLDDSDQLTLSLHFRRESNENDLLRPQTCSWCSLPIDTRDGPLGAYYNCMECKLFLQDLCGKLPRELQSPFHTQHPLTLFAKLSNPTGFFIYNVCEKSRSGITYHYN